MQSTGGPLDLKDLVLRVGLVGVSMTLFDVGFDVWNHGNLYARPLSAGAALSTNLLGIGIIFLALVHRPPRKLVWLVPVGLGLVLLVRFYLFKLDYRTVGAMQTDTGMITEYAVRGLARGQNPYTWNFSDFLRVYRTNPSYITPYIDGAVQNRAAYPALTYLLFGGTAFLGLSVPDAAFIGLALTLGLLFIATPSRWRPLVLLPLFVIDEYTQFALVGNQDVIFSFFLIGMVMLWRRTGWRAVLYGLACAFRQQSWMVAPFLLICIWNESTTPAERWRDIVRFVAVSVGAFIFLNLPFIIWDPAAWVLGVFEHVYAAFNVYSHGLGALSQYGLLTFSRQFYFVLQVSSYVIMLVIHWRHAKFIEQAFWVFPAVFFWLYYRGLVNYWIYWIPPLLLSLFYRFKETQREAVKNPTKSWVTTSVITAFLMIPSLFVGVYTLQRRPMIKAVSAWPFQVFDYGQKRINRLTVRVTNTGDETLRPGFAVQSNLGTQPLPWTIDSGPSRLPPGTTGEYVISASVPVKMVPVETGGQIVVMDRRKNDWRRAVITIPADESFVNPDRIVNPRFSFWRSGANVPEAWTLRTTAGSSASVRAAQVAGRYALAMTLDAASSTEAWHTARLVQTVTFEGFSIWVYPPAMASEGLQSVFGLELDDGRHKLWVLFGDSNDYGMLGKDFGYVFLPAPPRIWTRHTLHPKALYNLFGWQFPVFTQRQQIGLEYPARQVQLSLLVASRNRANIQGYFGPIEQGGESDLPGALLREALTRIEDYYINIGDEYRRQRNYDLARDVYSEALALDPTKAEGYFGLAEASFWLDNWDRALGVFEASLFYRYHQPALSFRGIGWSYYNLGNYQQAKRAFERAIQLDRGLADAYNGLGWVLLKQHRCDEAVGYFEQALRLDPDFPEPRLGVDECEKREKN